MCVSPLCSTLLARKAICTRLHPTRVNEPSIDGPKTPSHCSGCIDADFSLRSVCDDLAATRLIHKDGDWIAGGKRHLESSIQRFFQWIVDGCHGIALTNSDGDEVCSTGLRSSRRWIDSLCDLSRGRADALTSTSRLAISFSARRSCLVNFRIRKNRDWYTGSFPCIRPARSSAPTSPARRFSKSFSERRRETTNSWSCSLLSSFGSVSRILIARS